MDNRDWIVAGVLVAIMAIGLLLPRRQSDARNRSANENRGKLS